MQADSPEVVLRRARALLEISQLRPRDLGMLTLANAEHVVVWCKTNQWRSSQVDGALSLASAAVIAAGAAAACRSPSATLLPLLGGALLWRASQDEGLLCASSGAPAALHGGGWPLAPSPAGQACRVDEKQGSGLEDETDYVIVHEADVPSEYVLSGA